jgi:CDP-diacylglycerol--serine O-phosphatidyltransferase
MRRRHVPGEGAREAGGGCGSSSSASTGGAASSCSRACSPPATSSAASSPWFLTAQQRFTEAAVAIFVAMLLDILDGKVARLTNTTTQFGVEFDSLADVVSFCVAPAFMLYALVLAHLGRAAWLAAFLYVICGALRLARFNVYSGVTDRRFFVGPAHAGRGRDRWGQRCCCSTATRSRAGRGWRWRSGRTWSPS